MEFLIKILKEVFNMKNTKTNSVFIQCDCGCLCLEWASFGKMNRKIKHCICHLG